MLTISAIQTTPNYKITFKSNRERERELARLRELKLEKERVRAMLLESAKQQALERARQEELQINRERILEEINREIMKYPEPNDAMSVKMAGFLSQFTCAIQNNSEHDIREFFGDEETAASLREKLSPECQHNSLELREEIQKIDETKDPVMMLIAANNMKRFMPKDGLLNQEQQEALLQGIKDVVIIAIKRCDMSKFEEKDVIAINEMIQMIKDADSVNFGISVKLKALIDKLNKNALKLGFIPPVKVRELVPQMQRTIKA